MNHQGGIGMAKFRKKPVVIEAVQWRGPQDDPEVYRWLPHDKFCVSSEGPIDENTQAGRNSYLLWLELDGIRTY